MKKNTNEIKQTIEFDSLRILYLYNCAVTVNNNN